MVKIELELDEETVEGMKEWMNETGCRSLKEQCEFTLKEFARELDDGVVTEHELTDFEPLQIGDSKAHYKHKEGDGIVLFYMEDKNDRQLLENLQEIAEASHCYLIDMDEVFNPEHPPEEEGEPTLVKDWVTGMYVPVHLREKTYSKLPLDLYFNRDLTKDEVRRLLYKLHDDLEHRFGDDYDGWGFGDESFLSGEEMKELLEEI